MNVAELKQRLEKLHRHLNILKEREAKFGGDAPLGLLNQIEDHETAIALVEARLAGQVSDEELEERLAPLNLELDRRIQIKNFVQIGTGVIPTVPLVVLLLVVVAALAFLGVSFLGPAQMQGRFNVAVAEFGELNADGTMQPSPLGQRLSKWVFDQLERANEQEPSGNPVEIWHDSLPWTETRATIGLISGSTPEARAEAARALAQKIGADVVIYGHLAASENPAALKLEFYVSPRLRTEAVTTIGRYEFGNKPIRVPANFNQDDPLSREAVAGPLVTRTNALFWLILGLREELLGRSEEALKILRQAEEQLTGWNDDGEGKEHLYFFIGQSALFLNRDEEAQDAFERAVAINPKYARAQNALGSVYFKRAQCRLFDVAGQNKSDNKQYTELCQRKDGEPIVKCPDSEECMSLVKQDLEQTFENYQQGLELAQENHEPEIGTIARLALGMAYRLQGETYYQLRDDVAANRYFDPAIQEIQSVLEPLAAAEQYRLLGQAYQNLGAAYFQKARILQDQGDVEGSRALYEKARAAFDNCTNQGKNAPYYDEILTERIIAACESANKMSEEALLSLQGGQQ